MIRKAKISEIPDILRLTQSCAAHMIANGIFQWNEAYPSKAAFETDLSREELFVLEKENSIVGTVVVSTKMDKEYQAVLWTTPNEGNSYIHRLSVHPHLQGKGYARQLMDFAEAKAKEMQAPSVRLDTFSQNKRNQRFYEQRGYRRLGDIYFPKQSEHPFHCYELVL